ncbi:hypothetical protein SAMN02990966_03950 [Rhodospirillales bacterium URHD0017]|nr:hypothetical protein SAMN02990966_03950 [Rhodospirillales bacterium URHD0017]
MTIDGLMFRAERGRAFEVPKLHRRTPCLLVLLGLLLGVASVARAQDIEPRAYSNAPIGVNFLISGYVYTQGSLPTDPSIPVTSSHLTTSSAVLAYGHVFDFFGQSARINVATAYGGLGGSAVLAGQPIQRSVDGLSDTILRVSTNLYGAPAMDLREFRNYQQDLILGASVTVTLPTGQYDSSRLVNIGTNRWSFRPELGASKAFGPLTFELAAGPVFFTDNTNFLNGHVRSHAPIGSVQSHAIYDFGNGIWAALDAQYFTGGSTAIDGQGNEDLQSNWRVGATLALPLNQNFSLKLSASTGVYARTGNNYDLVGVFVQYRWGAGL